MARSIAGAVQQIKNEIDNHVRTDDIIAACEAAGHNWRQRVLGPVLTIRALLLQILHATAMTGVSRLVGVEFTAGAYCQALQRLPVAVLRTLLQRFVARQRERSEPVSRWRGLRVFFADGSSCSMPDTPALQRRFGQPSGQKPGCGFPVAHLLTMFDAYTGMLVDVLASSWRIHDLKRADELHPHLRPGDVLVADRGFGSYAHLALLQTAGVDAVFRAHQRRKVSFAPRQQRWGGTDWPLRLGHQDQLNVWRKTKAQSQALSPEVYAALPEFLVVRELRYRISQPGYRTREVTLVTTLLDARRYPAEALAELYGLRWQVEVNLRHLKLTLGMDVLRSQSVEGVERELLAFALVYNLVCAVRTAAAQHLRTTPERISVIDVLRLLRHGLANTAHPALVVNPNRPGRHQPRVRKRRPPKYPLMTRPRAELKKKLLENEGK